jgi:antirestriction protein ArdC
MKSDDSHTDIYQRITDQIIAAIEKGAGRFEMPWHANSGMPANAVSGKFYRGINVPVLWATAQEKGYDCPLWATYKQWQEKGAQVRKGEKSALVVFWKFFDTAKDTEEAETEPEERSGRRAMARSYPVFNAGQVDGFTPPLPAEPNQGERIQHAEAFFRHTGAVIKHGGPQAFYQPGTDEIRMPAFEAFKSPEAYYATGLHELTHWTGAPQRLDRNLKGRFGSENYSFEELVAELSAAYQMAILGLANEPRQEHAAYIQSWLKGLRDDKRLIFAAASHAQRAADYLQSLQPKQQPTFIEREAERRSLPFGRAIA